MNGNDIDLLIQTARAVVWKLARNEVSPGTEETAPAKIDRGDVTIRNLENVLRRFNNGRMR